jgi:hypothetical protein
VLRAVQIHDDEHIHDDDLDLYVNGRLEPGHSATVESHLLDCDLCREKLSRSIGMRFLLPYTEKPQPGRQYKRSEPRFSTGDEAILQEISPLSVERQTVQITDVSRSGLGLITARNIYPGTVVQVRMGQTVEVGEVRYCSPYQGAYKVGLHLNKEF